MANLSHDLLPCPFCGGSADEDHASDCWFKLREVGQSKARMAEAWNRRATPPSPSTAPVKDHVLREEVNSLRDVALEFHAHASLRERLRAAIDPLLSAPSTAPEAGERAAFEASRPSFEAAMRAAGHRTDRWGDGTYNGRTEYRWEGWVAALASRPAEVDDEGLPPLPPEAARAMKGAAAFFVKWQDAGKDLRGALMLYTAEQYRQGQRDAVAADRARRGKGGA